jgi:hypothetical protein
LLSSMDGRWRRKRDFSARADAASTSGAADTADNEDRADIKANNSR